MKTLQAKEKEEVGLQERRKHAVGKAKKLKKSIQEVFFSLKSPSLNAHFPLLLG